MANSIRFSRAEDKLIAERRERFKKMKTAKAS